LRGRDDDDVCRLRFYEKNFDENKRALKDTTNVTSIPKYQESRGKSLLMAEKWMAMTIAIGWR